MQVFGKLAKGAATLGAGENDSVLEQLMHRVKETTTLGEKRTALNDIKELLQNHSDARADFGPLGGISLMIELLTEREDLELIQMTLEILVIALTEEGTQTSVTSSANCELFIQSLDHLAIVLSLLEPEPTGIHDFYVYYHAVQILNSCLKSGLYKLQEVVHRRESGLNGLLTLLSEREVIRNEVLLLLIRLTSNHPSLQGSAAKGDIFVKLFEIVKSEGGPEGSIVVRDCLELIAQILRENEVTHKIFRESDMMEPLLRFLELVNVSTEGAEALKSANQHTSQQRIDHLKLALKLTEILVYENDADMREAHAMNCTWLNQADCLPVFSQLCLNQGGVRDVEVRIMALHCMSRVLLFVPDAKKLLVKLRVFFDGQPTEALLVLLKVALVGHEREESSAACSVLESFYNANREAQERALSSWITIEGCQATDYAFLAEMLNALDTCREGSETGRRAAQVLSCILRDNHVVQNACVAQQVTLPHGQDPSRVLYWLMDLLSEAVQFGSNPGICDALSICIVNVLEGFPAAVEALLQIESYVTFMITHLQKILDEIMAVPNWKLSGIYSGSFIFATCLKTVIEHPTHANAQAMSEYLKNAVIGSVGVDNFLYLLAALHDKAKGPAHADLHERLSQILAVLQPYFRPGQSHTAGEPLHSAPVARPAMAGSEGQAGAREDATVQKLREVHSELESTKAELQRVTEEHLSLKQQQQAKGLLQEKIAEQEALIEELRQQISAFEGQQHSALDIQTRNEMLVCLGIENTKVQVLSAKLFELGYDPDALLIAEMHKQL